MIKRRIKRKLLKPTKSSFVVCVFFVLKFSISSIFLVQTCHPIPLESRRLLSLSLYCRETNRRQIGMDSATLLQYQYHLLAEYQPFGCKQANRYFTYKWLLCWISRNEDNIRETLLQGAPLLCCWGQDSQIGEIGNQTNRQIANQGNHFVN